MSTETLTTQPAGDAAQKPENPVKNLGTPPAYFSCWGLQSYYGESYIVQDVSFNIHEGEIVALLGRNGAGKTSTLRTIARAANPELKHGEIWLDHKPLHQMKDYQAAQNGVGLVQEDRRIIPGLTVEENLELAQINGPRGWEIERLYEHFPRLAERRKQEGITMSGGEQQMLAIGRGLMAEPRRLILDEPSLGLSPLLVEEMFALIQKLRAEGLAIFLVEQNVVQSLEIADRAYVMENGLITVEGPAQDLMHDEELRRSYLGM